MNRGHFLDACAPHTVTHLQLGEVLENILSEGLVTHPGCQRQHGLQGELADVGVGVGEASLDIGNRERVKNCWRLEGD